MGTRRLGASLEWTAFDADWRAATLDALALNPAIPPPYEDRTTVTPLVKFAFTPELSVTGGVSITELDAMPPATGSTMANAAVGSIEYLRPWTDASGSSHNVYASFGVRAGSRALESDLVYTRYLGRGSYRYGWGKHRVLLAAMAGGITGAAPLFERFALGDSTTLRGWDKFEIAPAGGDRMFHSSVEYRYRVLGVFLDAGSVWDETSDRKVRVSAGLSFRAGPAFFAVGFPLNTDNMRAVFTMGLRAGVGVGFKR
jgi:outer membrane translocation and assembly module TamA